MSPSFSYSSMFSYFSSCSFSSFVPLYHIVLPQSESRDQDPPPPSPTLLPNIRSRKSAKRREERTIIKEERRRRETKRKDERRRENKKGERGKTERREKKRRQTFWVTCTLGQMPLQTTRTPSKQCKQLVWVSGVDSHTLAVDTKIAV